MGTLASLIWALNPIVGEGSFPNTSPVMTVTLGFRVFNDAIMHAYSYHRILDHTVPSGGTLSRVYSCSDQLEGKHEQEVLAT